MLRDKDGNILEIVPVKGLKLRRGGKEHLESIPWYWDGKEWYVEKVKLSSYLKGDNDE